MVLSYQRKQEKVYDVSQDEGELSSFHVPTYLMTFFNRLSLNFSYDCSIKGLIEESNVLNIKNTLLTKLLLLIFFQKLQTFVVVSGLTGFKKTSRDPKKGQRPKFYFVDDERKFTYPDLTDMSAPAHAFSIKNDMVTRQYIISKSSKRCITISH